MMVVYNLTNLTSSETIVDVASFANEVTDNALIGMLLVAIYLILMFRMKRVGLAERAAVAGFVCFVLSSMAAFAEMVPVIYPIGFGIVMGLPVLFLVFSGK